MTLASDIFTLVGQQLQDIGGVKWPGATTLLNYLNLCINETINLKPDAYPVTKNLSLVAGPIQSIATTDIMVVDFVCNMGSDGLTIGQVITALDKGKLDEILPDWMTFTPDLSVIFAMIDPRDPKTFYVFPPQPVGTGQNIRAIVTNIPDLLTDVSDPFPLDDSYVPSTVDYLVYRTLIEETTIPNAINKANAFYQKFMQDLGLKTNVEQSTQQKGQ